MHGRILVDGKFRGQAFFVSARTVLTARHVLRPALDAGQRQRADSVIQLSVDELGTIELSLDEADLALDLATLHSGDFGAPRWYRLAAPAPQLRWQVRSRPTNSDPFLAGTIDAVEVPFGNSGGHTVSVVQLHTPGGLQEYGGYSGSPVLQEPAEPGAPAVYATAVLVEQSRIRSRVRGLGDPASANILFAVPAPAVARRFGLPVTEDALRRSSTPLAQHLRGAVQANITEQLAALRNLGTLAVRWERLPPAEAGSTGDLADLVKLLADDRTQLIIAGESQSGKTTLATTLVQKLTAAGRHLPVLFPLSLWNPRAIALKLWMAEFLRTTYEIADEQDIRALSALLASGEIYPVFDGFDEIDAITRPRAADTIRQFLGNRGAVITTTPVGYDLLTTRACPNAVAIALRSVEPSEVSRYLTDQIKLDPGSSYARLAGSLQHAPDSHTAAALSSPLMAWLAKTIYQPAQDAPGHRHASELLDTAHFPSRASVEQHLLERLVDAVFERDLSNPSEPLTAAPRFGAAAARHWLRILASNSASRTIAFWEIRRYVPMKRLGLAYAVALTLSGWLLSRISPAVVAGLAGIHVIGLCFAFGFSRGYARGRATGPDDPTRIGYSTRGPAMDGDLREHTGKFALGALPVVGGTCLLAALVILLGHQSLSGLLPASGWRLGLLAGFAATVPLGTGAAGGFTAARVLQSHPQLDARTGARSTDPVKVISSDLTSAEGMAVLATAVIALTWAALTALLLHPQYYWGCLFAPLGAFVVLIFWSEWTCYKVAHLWLVVTGRLPLPFAAFLVKCHQLGILRKSGNYFEFRHTRLQDALSLSHRERSEHDI